jgi:hypothetical protein
LHVQETADTELPRLGQRSAKIDALGRDQIIESPFPIFLDNQESPVCGAELTQEIDAKNLQRFTLMLAGLHYDALLQKWSDGRYPRQVSHGPDHCLVYSEVMADDFQRGCSGDSSDRPIEGLEHLYIGGPDRHGRQDTERDPDDTEDASYRPFTEVSENQCAVHGPEDWHSTRLLADERMTDIGQ